MIDLKEIEEIREYVELLVKFAETEEAQEIIEEILNS